MKNTIEIGDLVRATGGIEGPPESIGVGIVLSEANEIVQLSWETIPKRWVILFEKTRHPWKLYEDDLEIVQKGG
jgi:hypothetical protein|tara:strand:- start:615 stop:836 length:222 start_codon:yes stop_codon:yes gene_type:complete